MADDPEFSRVVQLKHVDARPHRLEADEAERAALAKRFGLISIGRLVAQVGLERKGETVDAAGTMEAEIVQSCAVTGEDLPAQVREQICLRFVPEDTIAASEEEIELDAAELDEVPYAGTSFDLGEAIAQALALAIDPYATGPNAEAMREQAGLLDEESAGPFAALRALKGE